MQNIFFAQFCCLMLKPLQVFFFPPVPPPLPLHPLLFSHGHLCGWCRQPDPPSELYQEISAVSKVFSSFPHQSQGRNSSFLSPLSPPCPSQLLSSFLSENIKKILTPDLIRSRLAFLFLRIVNKITLLKKKKKPRMECKCCTNLITLWRWETLM